MKNTKLFTAATTAVITGVALQLLGDFAWNLIASFGVAALIVALEQVDAKT